MTPKPEGRKPSPPRTPRTLAEAERECAELRLALEAAQVDGEAMREVLATFGILARKLTGKTERSPAARRLVADALRALADEWMP